MNLVVQGREQFELKIRALAEREPLQVSEFLVWCKDCKQVLEEYEPVDAREFAPNEVHESAAMLVRLAKMYLRKFRSRELANGFPSMKAKHVTDAIIRFEQCIEWSEECLAGHGSAGKDDSHGLGLTPTVLRAYQSYEAAERALLESGVSRITDPAAYAWVFEQLSGTEIHEFPTRDTWCRYVREARNFFGTNKNQSRAGREGRSIISARENASNRTQTDS
jgi:hypothetical protein